MYHHFNTRATHTFEGYLSVKGKKKKKVFKCMKLVRCIKGKQF